MKPRPTILLALLLACGGSTPPPAASTPAPTAASGEAPTPEPSGPPAGATLEVADAGTPTQALDAGSGRLDAGSAGSSAPTPDAGPAFDFALVEQIVKQHKDAVRVACWDKSKSTEKAYVGTMSLRVGPTGNVVTVEVDGTDKPASQCIEKQVKTWKFPPPSGTATIKVPIRLRRD